MKGLLMGAFALAAAGCSSLPRWQDFDEKANRPPGYLAQANRAGAEAIPPPPEPGTPAHALDDAAFSAAQAARGSARWKWAAHDADVRFPQAADRFACALGMPIRPEVTPNLYMLLRRSFADAALAGFHSKAPFKRERPFVAGNHPTCTPEAEPALRKDYSYPSGAAAVGWAWALILMELSPERADLLAQRGLAYGESRSICGVHWKTDAQAGRLLGAVIVAQLHSNADFGAQLAAARQEVLAARMRRATSDTDCAGEAAALGGEYRPTSMETR
jgi:acid phosphatase (class A)